MDIDLKDIDADGMITIDVEVVDEVINTNKNDSNFSFSTQSIKREREEYDEDELEDYDQIVNLTASACDEENFILLEADVKAEPLYFNSNGEDYLDYDTGSPRPADFECDQCSYITTWHALMEKHQGVYQPDQQHKCSVCEDLFTCKFIWEQCERAHIKKMKKFFQCQNCPFKTKKEDAFLEHQTKHNVHECIKCDFETNRKKDLNNHYIDDHPEWKRFKCNLCHYKTKYYTNLNSHKVTHTGIRKYECEICTYATASSYTLARHMRMHTGEKLFKCNICSFTASRKDNFNTHLKLHYRKPSYQCETCSMKFMKKLQYEAHLMERSCHS